MGRIPAEIRAGVIVGLLSGLAGAVLFAVAHAILIVPIWDRMTFGLISGAIAGAGAGWAFAECYPQAIRARSLGGVGLGVRFGALLWLAVAPVTAVDAALRATGFTQRYELIAVGVALILALVGGGLLGRLITHRRRGSVAGAVAALLLLIAMAGPVPVARSPRALGIFLSVLPAAVIAGAALALLSPVIYRFMPARIRSSPQ